MAIWSGKRAMKKFQVKVKGMKLQGLPVENIERVKMAIQMNCEGPRKSGFSSLYKKSHRATRSFLSKEIRVFNLSESIEWDDEFDNVCSFSKDPSSFASYILSFHILFGKSEEPSSSSSLSNCKMQVIGKGTLNLGELASNLEAQIEEKIPISLELEGVAMAATLKVLVSFVEMRNSSHSRTMSHDSFGNAQSSGDSVSWLRRATSLGASNKMRLFGKQSSLRSSDESSATTLNSESEYVVVASNSRSGESNSVTELGSSPNSEAQLDLVKKGGFWKWKRRKSMKKTAKPDSRPEPEKSSNPGGWESKELVSRDGKTKLNAMLFFASYDQRSEQAAGQSACAAIVAVIAHWLQLNPHIELTRPEFDRLIAEGSSEWRKLCNDESNKECFPDHHFDLETIIRAELRPGLSILPNHSRFGFFHPEEFTHLKDAPSFDIIWDEISRDVNESRVYIVRWNDHFFVLKVEANANYIIDSLGERLHEGCHQAYVLKFDDSTVMYEEEENEEGKEKGEDSSNKVICRGKECCREYMKRFLAAIPLRELKEEEAKGKTLDVFALYQRLQIDFHLSSSPSSVNSSSVASPSTEPLLVDEVFVQV